MGSARTPSEREIDRTDPDSATSSIAIIKRCACGAVYSEEDWVALVLCGNMIVDDERAEIRHCRCGSTLALRKTKVGA